MEGAISQGEKLGSNEVEVVISGGQESSILSDPGRDIHGIQKFESGSYSFSNYLPAEPPSSGIQITQLAEEESLRGRRKVTSFSNSERAKPNPLKILKSSDDSFTPRRRILVQSAYWKPKSRLAEPSIPSTWRFDEENEDIELPVPAISSPYENSSPSSGKVNATTPKDNARAASLTPRTSVPITPRTPLMASLREEDDDTGADDDDVYMTGVLKASEAERPAKKLKVMFLIEFIAFLCIMIFLTASLTINKLKKGMIWGLDIWKWSVLVLVIFCGRLVSEWFTNLIVFLIERNFLLKKKVLYFVYSLQKSFRVFLWLGLVLLAWVLLFNRGDVNRSRETTRILDYITRALASTLIGAAAWMLKTFFVKLLASSFHVKKFFDRIQESIFHQYVLQTLSGPPLMEYAEKIGSSRNSGRLSFRSPKKGKKVEQQEVIDVEKLSKMKPEKVSAWTMGGLIKIIRQSGLSTLSDALDDSESVEEEGGEQKEKQITSEWEAKATAYRIFKNVAKHDRRHIKEEDLLRFMYKHEVDNVLPLFEGSVETGMIKKQSFCNWVVKVYNERKFLAHSLNDTKTAIEELNRLVSGILLVVLVIVWLLLMGFATTQVLVFITSQLLLLVFMFGNTCMAVFEAIIFIFVVHPFDVGDRCVVEGEQLVVEEMNILTTIFLRYDNQKIFYPNAVLATKAISNYNRSPEMFDSVEFDVDVSTSVESIVALKAKIKAYLESKRQHWRPKHSVRIQEIENVNKMKMRLYVKHTMNFQNYDEKCDRRSDLVFELKKIFEETGIKYHLLPQEVP